MARTSNTEDDMDNDMDKDSDCSQPNSPHAEGMGGCSDRDDKTEATDDSDNDSVNNPSKNDSDVGMGPPFLLTDSPSPTVPPVAHWQPQPHPNAESLPWISVDTAYQTPTLNDLENLKYRKEQLDPTVNYPIGKHVPISYFMPLLNASSEMLARCLAVLV
jgi:hypothetical protein